jgi:hypothetical protein
MPALPPEQITPFLKTGEGIDLEGQHIPVPAIDPKCYWADI